MKKFLNLLLALGLFFSVGTAAFASNYKLTVGQEQSLQNTVAREYVQELADRLFESLDVDAFPSGNWRGDIRFNIHNSGKITIHNVAAVNNDSSISEDVKKYMQNWVLKSAPKPFPKNMGLQQIRIESLYMSVYNENSVAIHGFRSYAAENEGTFRIHIMKNKRQGRTVSTPVTPTPASDAAKSVSDMIDAGVQLKNLFKK